MAFRPTILVASPNLELRWLGHILRPRIFDGEKFFGILAGLSKAKLDGGTKIRLHRDKPSIEASGRSGVTTYFRSPPHPLKNMITLHCLHGKNKPLTELRI
jgi:hypothetical protein